MIADEIRAKLQNIVRGELQEGQMDSCSATRNLLCKSFGTGPTVKSEFAGRTILKEKQVSFLKAGLIYPAPRLYICSEVLLQI